MAVARDVFETHVGRPIVKLDHYFPIYDRHFGRFVDRPLKFLEIGAGRGGSAQMWKQYFGASSHIVSIDINPRAKNFEEERIDVRIGDQSDVTFLASVVEEFGTFDCVLDDGSHVMKHLAATFDFLYPKIASDGIYMVEDLCTAYWPSYGGGLCRQGSFIETSKALIDQLSAQHIQEADFIRLPFADSTTSMHFYDSIIVFERGQAPIMKKVRNGRVLD